MCGEIYVYKICMPVTWRDPQYFRWGHANKPAGRPWWISLCAVTLKAPRAFCSFKTGYCSHQKFTNPVAVLRARWITMTPREKDDVPRLPNRLISFLRSAKQENFVPMPIRSYFYWICALSNVDNGESNSHLPERLKIDSELIFRTIKT